MAVCAADHQQARWALLQMDPTAPTPAQTQWALWWRRNMEGTPERRRTRELAREMDMDPDEMIRYAVDVQSGLSSTDQSTDSTETDSTDTQ
jgi:hypothetical protein